MPPKAFPASPEQAPAKSKKDAVVVDESADQPKYEIVRAATGTGVISSVLTLSTLILLNEIRFFLYYRNYLYMNPFGNFMFSAGFIISILQFFTFFCVLFFPTYLYTGNKSMKLAPLALSCLLQLFMLSLNNTDLNLRAFFIQNDFDKFLIIKNLAMTYGAFFGSVFLFVALNSGYETKWNALVRPFEYADYSSDSAV